MVHERLYRAGWGRPPSVPRTARVGRDKGAGQADVTAPGDLGPRELRRVHEL